MINVFEYTDYRALLHDLYAHHKEQNSAFSYRYIGQKVGFKSAGFFTNIISGKRNISADLIFSFAELFKFSKKETEYFETLVLYDQAKQHNQKKFYYEKLLTLTTSSWHQLQQWQYEYFNSWYNVAIRELLGVYRFSGNYRELAQLIRPAITPRQAQEAVQLLKQLELIYLDEQEGFYKVTNKAITTAGQVPQVAVHAFQRTMMQKAAEAMDAIPVPERSISTVTFSASVQAYQQIEERLAAFRQEVRQIIKDDHSWSKQVYQFNLQCFPLSRQTGEQQEQ
jgi:uncharacterized protein (TIGR02147 family)